MSEQNNNHKQMGPKPPIPVSVLTGFLGSGKTTLLNKILQDPSMSDAAVIINEFGEVGLDHLLVETSDEGILELSSGCLCCTIRGDLIETLEGLLQKRDTDQIKLFNRVIIETTGLADPAPVLHTIMSHPYLLLRYSLDGVIVTVDAVNAVNTLLKHAESVKQVAVADRIILTKTDIADADQISEVKDQILSLNHAVPIMNAADGQASVELLFNCGLYNPETKSADVNRWLNEVAVESKHHHSHHHHDVNRHNELITSFAVRCDEPMSISTVEMFLDLLRGMHGENLLRVKGIINLKEDPDHPLVVHGVQHVFHPPAKLDSWPDNDRSSRLVLITHAVDKQQVQGLLSAFSGEPKVDQPAAETYTNNPLSLLGQKGP